jgi:DDE domain
MPVCLAHYRGAYSVGRPSLARGGPGQRFAGTCATTCPSGTSKSCLRSAASRSTSHHLPLGAAVARPSSSRPPGLAGMRPVTRWFADETYVKVAGRWAYLYRTVDQHGQVIDVLLSARRDLAAARRFSTRALRSGTVPAEVTTDRAPAYPRVLDELTPQRCTPSNVTRTTRSRLITGGQSKAAADARTELSPRRADPGVNRRARVRAEPSPGPLRSRRRCPARHRIPIAIDQLTIAI